MTDLKQLPAPMKLWSDTVSSEWIDYNGHMTEFRYLQVFSDNLDLFYEKLGIDPQDISMGSYYTVETHLRHLAECKQGASLCASIQILGYNEKKLHVFQRIIRDDGIVVATAEQFAIYVISSTSASAPASIQTGLCKLMRTHEALEPPSKMFCTRI